MKVEFDPRNEIVRLCLQGIALESENKVDESVQIFNRALGESKNDFDKYLASYYIARSKVCIEDKLAWYKKTLKLAQGIEDVAVSSALSRLYFEISNCYKELDDELNTNKYLELSNKHVSVPIDNGPFYHGTKADLKTDDLLVPGGLSNYKDDFKMNHIYFTALVNGAGLAAGLANGNNPERVYIVEPTGDFENDPNVTNMKFPGNPTRSYRSLKPLKVIGEVINWNKQTKEELDNWKKRVKDIDGEIIN